MSDVVPNSVALHLTTTVCRELHRLEDLLTMPLSVVLEEYAFVFSREDYPLYTWLSEYEEAMLGVFLYQHIAAGDEAELRALAKITCKNGANPVAMLLPCYLHFVD